MSIKRMQGNCKAGRRLVGIQDLADYLGMGRTNANKVGIEAQAKCKIGSRALYDLERVDAFIDAKMAAGATE